jgi:hypothetical protein
LATLVALLARCISVGSDQLVPAPAPAAVPFAGAWCLVPVGNWIIAMTSARVPQCALLLAALQWPAALALHGRREGEPALGGPRTCADAHGPITSGHCVAPGVCTAPPAPFSAVAVGPSPALQWDISGGFCGAFSVQQSALAAGAFISQDLVRKANIDQPGPHHMHGDPNMSKCSSDPLGCGWEVA